MKEFVIYQTKKKVFEVRSEKNGVYLYDENGKPDLNGWGKICSYTPENTPVEERIKEFLKHTEKVKTEKTFLEYLKSQEKDEKSIFERIRVARKKSAEGKKNKDLLDLEEAKNSYLQLVGKGKINVTEENLKIVMNYLRRVNWGGWSLPAMDIGYSANQYDCDGKIAVTVTLDKPLNGVKKFQMGAPRGHLEKYKRI